jgi:hypothetical protein
MGEMATPETKIDFTVGDQQTLARIEALNERVLDKLKHLPCQDQAVTPCPQEDRMIAIEQKANRAVTWIQSIVATIFAGGIVAALAVFLDHMAK